MAVEIENIKRVRLFAKLNETEQRQLAKVCNARSYRSGEVIFTEGEEGKDLLVVKEGVVDITKRIETQLRADETQTLTSLRSGEWFGLFTFFLGGTHSASAVAQSSVSLLVLDRDDFNKVVSENPQLGYKVMCEMTVYLGELLREMNKRFMGLVSYMWGEKR